MPTFIGKFILDFVETGLATLFLLNIVLPTDVEQAKQVAITVGVALASAFVSAFRRTTPAFLGWLKVKLGVE